MTATSAPEPQPPIRLRPIEPADLPAAAAHQYTLSIVEPLTDLALLRERHAADGFWAPDAGARAIVDDAGRLVGTTQFYRAGLCIHGYEIGYIVHDEADYGRGFATAALRAMSELLWRERPDCYRLQLIIETWNEASCRVARKCGYEREGVLRRGGYGALPPEDAYVYSLVRS